MNIRARLLAALALAAALGACATVPDSPRPESPPAPEGSFVALGEPVTVGEMVATPMEVLEDSRCPINARCIWAGRLVVKTRIDGGGWRETADLTLGEPYSTHDTALALVSGEPAPEAGEGKQTLPADYRFAYAAR
ncbi:hypothetical protein [Erythrobacter donghaensis]|uniref:hypothetical protein n=1 Tax=Erythrobacter donghaensis TaxID=267135 RepID=UPI000A37FEB8|nr:hypothetical protein [Erythrobacter donghaensis]